ncbi:MAG: PLDc N-terminal domain-containing protein [Desulfovibrionaceae bacterium]|nr:PLDc N-terminal domain-containing protein [Desulfovibrionaceae bacterium]
MQGTWLLYLEGALLLTAHVFSWMAIAHALLHKRDPRAALGWTVTALFLPGIGALLYLLFGIGRADSRAATLMRKAEEVAREDRARLHGGSAGPPTGILDSESLPRQYRHMARLGHGLTGRHLTGGNAVMPLFNGEEAYPAMLEAINKARTRVYLVTYIFNAGRIADAFVKALCDAAARGVDVRVLADGVGGSVYTWKSPLRALPKHGVQVARFLPLRLFPPQLSINLRDHRKVLVCDGTGFTGGMNIADYNLSNARDYRVQDVHFLCSGPIVTQLEAAFLLDWGFATRQYDIPPRINDEMCGDTLCRIVLDGPGSGKDPLHDLICGVLSAARHTVRMMTPYFLPTHEMIAALKSAALRGVRVSVVLPAKNNLPYVHWATLHLLPGLMETGVRIFFQPPPFAHTKLLMIDGYYTQFGSANMDPRSLRLNFELNIETFDTSFTREMTEHFDAVRARSRELTPDDLARRRLPARLRNAACWIFSPYL